MNHWGMLGVAVVALVIATLFFNYDKAARIGETPEERWERIVEGARAEKDVARAKATAQARAEKGRRHARAKTVAEAKAVARARNNRPKWYEDAARGKRPAEQHPCLPLNPDSRSRFEQGWWKGLDGKGDTDCTNRIFTAFQMRNMILGAGYRCDSISSILPMIFSHGYTVRCNRLRYAYEIEDRGGNWHVELD